MLQFDEALEEAQRKKEKKELDKREKEKAKREKREKREQEEADLLASLIIMDNPDPPPPQPEVPKKLEPHYVANVALVTYVPRNGHSTMVLASRQVLPYSFDYTLFTGIWSVTHLRCQFLLGKAGELFRDRHNNIGPQVARTIPNSLMGYVGGAPKVDYITSPTIQEWHNALMPVDQATSSVEHLLPVFYRFVRKRTENTEYVWDVHSQEEVLVQRVNVHAFLLDELDDRPIKRHGARIHKEFGWNIANHHIFIGGPSCGQQTHLETSPVSLTSYLQSAKLQPVIFSMVGDNDEKKLGEEGLAERLNAPAVQCLNQLLGAGTYAASGSANR